MTVCVGLHEAARKPLSGAPTLGISFLPQAALEVQGNADSAMESRRGFSSRECSENMQNKGPKLVLLSFYCLWCRSGCRWTGQQVRYVQLGIPEH